MHQVPPPQQFQIGSQQYGDTAVLQVAGEFDLAAEQHFVRTIDRFAHDARSIVVDLTGVTFIDSSGLRALLSAWNLSQSDGWDLTVVPGTGQVHRAMDLTGVDRVLPIAAEATPVAGSA